jgi:hypothetical protein
MSNTLTTDTIANEVTDFDLAVTGVFSLHSISDWTVQDWQDNGIDPDADDYEESCRTEYMNEFKDGDMDADDSGFEMEWDGYEQRSLLVGFKRCYDGKHDYEEDETADYSAIVSLDFAGGVVQVTRSKFFIKGAWASPCFPCQVDADTEGNILAYALDPEDIHTDECPEGVELAARIFTRPE